MANIIKENIVKMITRELQVLKNINIFNSFKFESINGDRIYSRNIDFYIGYCKNGIPIFELSFFDNDHKPILTFNLTLAANNGSRFMCVLYIQGLYRNYSNAYSFDSRKKSNWKNIKEMLRMQRELRELLFQSIRIYYMYINPK